MIISSNIIDSGDAELGLMDENEHFPCEPPASRNYDN